MSLAMEIVVSCAFAIGIKFCPQLLFFATFAVKYMAVAAPSFRLFTIESRYLNSEPISFPTYSFQTFH
ncbi:hypothetical protein BDV25DRAFT_152609 [Aspergillus avenaceus]|uniref:Uncharacterized protein n=1 Tax=Aspergillus avenaceus TaxID=36643 RepID=A0A5N6TYN8_ASPAV|nr:hypothetical protein BDV25DRAFT_152609 [Aspergillus avenaceus]